MKFLLTLISIYFTLLLFKSTFADDDKLFTCEWVHENGESGWKCNDGGFYDDDIKMYVAYGNGSYTSLKKVEHDYVKDHVGWLIDLKDIKQRILEDINHNRKIHKAAVLTEDNKLKNEAQGIANRLAQSGDVNDSSVPKQNGESRACLDRKEIINVVKNWYDQRKTYNYESPDSNNENKTGDFSQMVWGESKSLGCGIANKNSTYCIVCKYSPPGNIKGQYSKNVRKDHDTVTVDFKNN
ncbi:CAP domain-containing protein [Strongyloides ratti]|uniref:CAP domain-containing protein n=1 Tax=Strongyloides ratti TaxID=34506 RepID=A0A090N066_STRRB|nr:CAP domain-containing protein [Strongyloides ratti]CEF70150.1 CAP domain-containing protein [Strongyloides ratti]